MKTGKIIFFKIGKPFYVGGIFFLLLLHMQKNVKVTLVIAKNRVAYLATAEVKVLHQVGKREKERQRQRRKEKEREGDSVCVCVCVNRA